MKPYNIASALFEMAESRPDAMAIAFPKKNSIDKNGITSYQQISFRELAYNTACVSRGLLAAGFERGDRVVVMVQPGFEFFVLGFSMLSTGIVPVFIDPGIGMNSLKQCIADVEPNGFIGISRAHVARVIMGWGRKTIRKTVTIGPRLFWGGKSMETILNYDRSQGAAPFFDAGSEDLAAIIFTSGSTGLAKGVVYSHGNFRAQLEMIQNTFGFLPGEINLPTFPPFALFNPALGMSSVIPDMDSTKPALVDPMRIIGPIKQFGISNMFGSPALIDVVGRYGESNGVKLPTLKKVISAGAPASIKTLKRFTSMLNPGVEIFTPYGSTEAMPVTKVGSGQILGEAQAKTSNGSGVCIGKAVTGMEIAIIRISDKEIPYWSEELKLSTGEIGEIVVKGMNVTQTYFNREAATSLAKIFDGDDVRHRMGDLGYFDADGDLWFCGRKSHRVYLKSFEIQGSVVGGRELYSIPVEDIFNKHQDVFRTALVGVDGKAILCVETEKGGKRIDRAVLKGELLAWAAAHPMTGDIRTILFHPGFPVDFRHNAKIIREELAVWAKKEMA